MSTVPTTVTPQPGFGTAAVLAAAVCLFVTLMLWWAIIPTVVTGSLALGLAGASRWRDEPGPRAGAALAITLVSGAMTVALYLGS